jgi:hypothetical protein
MEDHVREHFVVGKGKSEAAEQLIDVVHAYIK